MYTRDTRRGKFLEPYPYQLAAINHLTCNTVPTNAGEHTFPSEFPSITQATQLFAAPFTSVHWGTCAVIFFEKAPQGLRVH